MEIATSYLYSVEYYLLQFLSRKLLCDDFESNGNGHFLSEKCGMLSVAISKQKNFSCYDILQ
jgi:hypothetical protein